MFWQDGLNILSEIEPGLFHVYRPVNLFHECFIDIDVAGCAGTATGYRLRAGRVDQCATGKSVTIFNFDLTTKADGFEILKDPKSQETHFNPFV
ncbi:hypothetical protein HY17_10620 [Hyphomonas sp. CY54-11-8]|nr:hypothetical protein HY17_10620 [Hyphomonas sp. CY54-11-8]